MANSGMMAPHSSQRYMLVSTMPSSSQLSSAIKSSSCEGVGASSEPNLSSGSFGVYTIGASSTPWCSTPPPPNTSCAVSPGSSRTRKGASTPSCRLNILPISRPTPPFSLAPSTMLVAARLTRLKFHPCFSGCSCRKSGIRASRTSLSESVSTVSFGLNMKFGMGADLEMRAKERLRLPSGFCGGRGRVERRRVLGWASQR